MFWNYLKIALRNLSKNRLFAAINIVGLAVGLTTFVFTSLVVNYEISHDSFFEDSEHIYTIGTTPKPTADHQLKNMNATATAVGPIVEAQLSEIEAVTRVFPEAQTVHFGDNQVINETVSFVDPGFPDVFRFSYIHGSKEAVLDPATAMITASMAKTLFGDVDAVGESISVNNRLNLRVAAVIEDIPVNSHFHLDQGNPQKPQQIFTSVNGLSSLKKFDPIGDWNGLLWRNQTYVRLPEYLDRQWLENQLAEIHQQHTEESGHSFGESFSVRPIYVSSMASWDRMGIPIITILPILGVLILFVACLNYTNLAIAQSLGRSREIGMRKTMGASPAQLLAQFTFESLIVAAISMIIAIASLEVLIPLFNNATGKILNLDYLTTLPWIVGTAVVGGLLAGIYPAWLITRTEIIDALNEKAKKGRSGITTRSMMIGAQFAISIFMMASVAVVFAQNKKLENEASLFPYTDIYLIFKVQGREYERLKLSLEESSLVESVSFSSQIPFQEAFWVKGLLLEPGDEASEVVFQTLSMTPEFLDTYNIPLLAGRNLDKNIAQDVPVENVSEVLNVIINETAASRLGFKTPQGAINYRLHAHPESTGSTKEYVVVGVVADRNIVGFNQALNPWVFTFASQPRIASIRIRDGQSSEAIEQITAAWDKVSPNRPINLEALTSYFDLQYAKFRILNSLLAMVAAIAVTLSLVGLFGLTTLTSVQRTKEIGIRKILGANSGQIMRLLIIQVSKPIIWALCLVVPVLIFATNTYLGYFANPINAWMLIILGAALGIVLIGWAVIIAQTYRVARANPILALRHE